MSESAPVKIDPDHWPVIAHVDWHDGQIECQALEIAAVKVREHSDGRRLVYGWVKIDPDRERQGSRDVYAGYLVVDQNRQNDDPSTLEADTIRAIRRVAGVINHEELGAECIGDLPAQGLE